MKLPVTLLTFACTLAFTAWAHGAPTVYFSDSFDTGNDGGSYDVNDNVGSPRQGGTLVGSGIDYAEASATAAGGATDFQTQVNNPGYPDALLLAASTDYTSPVSVSPDLNFGATPVSIGFSIQLADMTDSEGYSYIDFGSSTQNENTGGLQLQMYADGSFGLYNDSATEVASGTGTALTSSSQVPVLITLNGGEVYLSINGVQQDLNGAAAGDGYADTSTSNYLTLGEANDTGAVEASFISGLAVTSPISIPEPSSVALLLGGLVFAAFVLRRRA